MKNLCLSFFKDQRDGNKHKKGNPMLRDNTVVFKSNSKSVTIILNSDVDFETLKLALIERLKEAKGFFKGVKIPLLFKGRDLTEEEELILIKLVSEESGVDITYVRVEGKQRPVIEQEREQPINFLENTTKYYKGSLRSGQTIASKGSVVIIGDVNPGGEVTAAGNIVVLGSLFGKAHAGCEGNTRCFVFALKLFPIQLRIGEIMTYVPKEITNAQKKNAIPSYAYVQEDRIYIAPRL